MDLAALRKRTRLISGFEMAATRSDVEMDDVINDAYLAVCDVEEWPFKTAVDTFTTTSGTDSYDLSVELTASIEDPLAVVIEDADGTDHPWPLEEVTQRWVDRAVDEDDDDLPQVYARTDETNIVLAPTPDDTYTVQVRGYVTISELSADTDTPVFKSRFHPVICYFAAATLLDEEGRFEESERIERRGSQFLDRMRDKYMSTHDDTPVVMGSRSRRYTTRWRGRLWPWRA